MVMKDGVLATNYGRTAASAAVTRLLRDPKVAQGRRTLRRIRMLVDEASAGRTHDYYSFIQPQPVPSPIWPGLISSPYATG